MSAADALLADREGVRSGGSSSKFKGVSWDRKNQKWKAQICIDGKSTYLGIFDNEEEAARKYDENAAYLGKTVNFPAEHGVAAEAAPKGGPSKYRGVSWSKSKRKWITQINIDGKPTYLGAFESEEEAALKYDEHASYLGRPVNFPSAENQGLAEKGGSHGGSSKFKGVSWIKSKEKWLAQINVDGKNTYLGIFESEDEAARKYDERAVALGRVLNYPDGSSLSSSSSSSSSLALPPPQLSSSTAASSSVLVPIPPPTTLLPMASAAAIAAAFPAAAAVAVSAALVPGVVVAEVGGGDTGVEPAAKRAKTGEEEASSSSIAAAVATAVGTAIVVTPAAAATASSSSPPSSSSSSSAAAAAAAAVAAPAGNETSEAEHTEQVNMLMKEQEAVAQSVRTRDTELALLLLAQGEAQPARKEGDEEAAASAVELVKEGAHI